LSSPRPDTAATFTRQGMLLGARLALPVMPGLVFYCMAFGAAAAHTGLSALEAVSMSGLVYAGAAQMLSLELWRDVWTPGALATVAIVTATVNARMILMGAAMQPWIRQLPPGWQAFNLFFLTDANWLIGTRYHAEGGRDLGVLFGAGIAIWAVWVAATLPGYFTGALIHDPRVFAIDLVLPVFFAILIVPLWRGIRTSLLPWLAAAIVATLVQALVPGYAFIVAGAIAGALMGAALSDRR
jgi:predicted branched-subunit amino acid permease